MGRELTDLLSVLVEGKGLFVVVEGVVTLEGSGLVGYKSSWGRIRGLLS